MNAGRTHIRLCHLWLPLMLLLVSFPMHGMAHPADTLYRDSVYRQVILEGRSRMNCYFSYPSGGSKILQDYGNNSAELYKLDGFIRSAIEDTLVCVRQVVLTGYSSIEGSYDLNRRLSRDRAFGLKTWLDFRYGLSRRYAVEVSYFGEDWGKLRELVAGSDLDEKTEVLMIIDEVDLFKGREKRLMDLNVGIPYHRMEKDFFPLLRRVEITVDYDLRRIIEHRYRRKVSTSEFAELLARERAAVAREESRLDSLREVRAALSRHIREEQVRAREDSLLWVSRAKERRVEVQSEGMEQNKTGNKYEHEYKKATKKAEAEKTYEEDKRIVKKEGKRPFIALKSNLLLWGGVSPSADCRSVERTTFMPNLSAELFFFRRWSLCVSGMYADWDYEGGKQHLGVSGYRTEGRFWLTDGWGYRWFFLGVYAQAGDFDLLSTAASLVSAGENHCTGTYVEGGLSTGCYFPLGSRLGIEVGARGGWRRSAGKAYDVEGDERYFNHSVKKSRMGLTGLVISLSYRFGRK